MLRSTFNKWTSFFDLLLQLRQDFKAAYQTYQKSYFFDRYFEGFQSTKSITIKDVDGKLLSIEEFMGKIISMTEAICRYLNKKSDEVDVERTDGWVQVANYQHHLAEAFLHQSSPYNKWISQLKECKWLLSYKYHLILWKFVKSRHASHGQRAVILER